jgi:molecular chaperone GrpE
MGENENIEEAAREEPAANGPEGTAPAPGLQKLQEERDSLYDRLLRKQAEFENFKKRAERERSDYIQFASADLMRELLNALDSFELAIRNAGAERASSQGMLEGFSLIYKQFQDTLTRFGLKAIEAKGQQFDPNIHQAVATTATDEVPENTVVDEFRKGYMLNGRLLRPAMVNVAVREQGSKN